MHMGEFGNGTDQVAGRVCAVPTVEGDTMWGYTSIPQAGVQWWKRLPNEMGKLGMTELQFLLMQIADTCFIAKFNFKHVVEDGKFAEDERWFGSRKKCDEAVEELLYVGKLVMARIQADEAKPFLPTLDLEVLHEFMTILRKVGEKNYADLLEAFEKVYGDAYDRYEVSMTKALQVKGN